MDGSFLSNPDVISASRDFVCVRLSTYESASEIKLLGSLFLGRDGAVENTTFALLAPDGTTTEHPAGRSPSWAFDGPADMARGMQVLQRRYSGRSDTRGPLPVVEPARLALNVAACDGLPLVVVYASSTSGRKALAKQVAHAAWGPLQGQAVFATVASRDELEGVTGTVREGVLVIAPDPFGQAGRVLKHLPAGQTQAQLTAALREACVSHSAQQIPYREHVREGRRKGVHWETQTPVTDSHGARGRR